MVILSGGILGPPEDGSQGRSTSRFDLCALTALPNQALRIGIGSNLYRVEAMRGRDEFILRRDGQDFAGSALFRALDQAVDGGRRFGQGCRGRARARVMNEEE